MTLTEQERTVGRENYYDAVARHDELVGRQVGGVNRRGFLKEVLGAGAVTGLGLGAMYFGYQQPSNPVRIGIIGTGDEGGVLIGALNPDYVQVVAISDIRPSSIHRALHGDWSGGDPYRTHGIRPGLMDIYGWKTESEARKQLGVYTDGYEDIFKHPGLEGVIIALPLHLHAEATIKALAAGKHVLCEKLMGHDIAQCKLMGRAAAAAGQRQGRPMHLAVGHQRHYSVLYDNAVELIRSGALGEIQHIRAQWHRGNLPGNDSWQPPVPGGEYKWAGPEKGQHVDEIYEQLRKLEDQLAKERMDPKRADLLRRQVAQWTEWNRDRVLIEKAKNYGYDEIENFYADKYPRTALEELVRWRLWERTGGGLMAELGSHQLDAASIFVSALGALDTKTGRRKKAHPLNVHAVGGRNVFPYNRDSADQVYCMFEFPGVEYEAKFDAGYYDPIANFPPHDPEKPHGGRDRRIVVTYSSINGNGFGGYGETVMGSKGTLVLAREQEVLLYGGSDTSTRVGLKADAGGGGVTLDTQESGGGAVAKAVEKSGPVSRGYTEEIEHWAWCIRKSDPDIVPRCGPVIALGDAIMALSARDAITATRNGKPGYIEFQEAWFDINDDAVPEGTPTIEQAKERLKKKGVSLS